MGAFLHLIQLGRSAFLAGALCTGLGVDPIGPDCARVQGNPTCDLPGGIRVTGETVFLWWPENRPGPAVLVNGTAKVQRGSEAFSGEQVLLQWVNDRSGPTLATIEFNFDSRRYGTLGCSE